ncbi:TauD/TfdA dioxygenase family protein [Sphingomonas abietis]|uniref:Uncharacterized protein n=1 Tax=Sphingomonas abietis TaxID=3012344 RepID=A0ABY7NSH6_9SPHN|nr:hypothetical protein [Sphingomonas abietis]WBO23745.1 hypothetical protein PBT88_06380 [Sphingomonas abietis]
MASRFHRLPACARADAPPAMCSKGRADIADQSEPDEGADRYRAEFIPTLIEAVYSLIRVHPETGERPLVPDSVCQAFAELGAVEPGRLDNIIQAAIVRLENGMRRRDGDVAIRHDRATAPDPIDDDRDRRHVVRGVTVRGNVPVGIDSRCSRRVTLGALPELCVA